MDNNNSFIHFFFSFSCWFILSSFQMFWNALVTMVFEAFNGYLVQCEFIENMLVKNVHLWQLFSRWWLKIKMWTVLARVEKYLKVQIFSHVVTLLFKLTVSPTHCQQTWRCYILWSIYAEIHRKCNILFVLLINPLGA